MPLLQWSSLAAQSHNDGIEPSDGKIHGELGVGAEFAPSGRK